MPLIYRDLSESSDFEAVTDLEMLIWNMPPRQSISADVLHVAVHTGGHVLGAFDGENLVGFTVAFAMKEPERLWSHIAAVHPAYQSQGIGYELKYRQRAWALAQGYKRMSWTFDPLQRRNAHFNFHVLGAECQTYHENFYGAMSDGINAGLPSDRFEVLWEFAEKARPIPPKEAPFLLKNSPKVLGHAQEAWHFVAIPYDLQGLKAENPQQAFEWRLAMRRVFGDAFVKGYRVVDFIREAETQEAYYCLAHS